MLLKIICVRRKKNQNRNPSMDLTNFEFGNLPQKIIRKEVPMLLGLGQMIFQKDTGIAGRFWQNLLLFLYSYSSIFLFFLIIIQPGTVTT